MMGSPNLPRSGRLLGGGTNSMELLWATLGLILAAIVLALSSIGWVAIWVESRIAGTNWTAGILEMPGLLAGLVSGPVEPTLAQAVAAPWRPMLVATVLAATMAGGAIVGLRAWWDWQAGWRHRQRARERLHSRVWARRRDLAPLLATPPRPGTDEPPAAGRLLVGSHEGGDILVPKATSVMVVAPTRTGKSTRLVVPNLLRWDGPAVVTSVKRDVYDLTVHRRSHFGPTVLFDPTGATGLETVRWSPLLNSLNFPDATKTATWLTDAAAVEDRNESAKFWETLATKFLAPMLFAAANTGRTITDVSHWVDRSAFDAVGEILSGLKDVDAQAAWQAIKDLPNETRGSVLGTAMAIFRAFGSPRVRAATSCTPAQAQADDVLDIPSMLRDNGTLYLVSPEYEQTELRPVFVALVQAIYRAAVDISANVMAGAPLNPPLLLMLDEAGNIAPLQNLPKIAATGAGQGITLMTIWQDRAQIRELYREAERTLISNHTSTVWLPGSQDLDTLKLLSDLIGDQWVASSTVSSAPDGGLSVSEGSERIDLAPPAFLRTLRHDQAIMLSGNTPPALVATSAYYEEGRWRQHVDHEVLARYSQVHDEGGPRTQDQLRSSREPTSAPAANAHPSHQRAVRGAVGRMLDASYPPIKRNHHDRDTWRPAGAAIPNELLGGPARWVKVTLDAEEAARLQTAELDLCRPDVRQRVLPILLEEGPASLIARAVPFHALAADWNRLPLTDLLRNAWEDAYPTLRDDTGDMPAAA